ncbi:hypothetical protein HK098_008011, partial [Nowakowskiella sp. JEL0407]
FGGPPPPPPPPGFGGPPPPPPPPGMGGPPPPPPPPGMGGPPPPPLPGMGGPPPPPPPGMGGPPPPPGFGGPPAPPGFGGFAPYAPAVPQPPAKKTNLSTKPLKSLNWTKLPPLKIKDTIWKDLDDEPVHSKLKEEYNTFEDLFAAKETKILREKTTEEAASVESLAPKEITFLDAKRSQNCNIMFKAIRLQAPEIKRALHACDTEVLTQGIVTELLKFIPTEEEILMLKQYENEIENLASAEKFLYELSEISRYGEKLKALHFRTCYDEYVDDADVFITALNGAATDVQTSPKFKELLKIILALGNYMNSGARGGAYGFKLGTLLKLVDTKSGLQGRKHTLMHYLSELLERKFPDVVGFEKELSHVEEGAKITIPQIRQVMVTLRDNLRELESLLTKMKKDSETQSKKPPTDQTKSDNDINTKFMESMQKFYDEADRMYKALDERFKKAEKEYETAVMMFGEDTKTCFPDEFFGVFKSFVQAYITARQDNENAILKEKEREKKEAALK